MLKLPNLELMEYQAQEAFFKNNKENYVKKIKETGMGVRRPLFIAQMFPQTWGSTCTAFDVNKKGEPMMGGSAMTEAYTVVFFESITETYIVFVDGRICYQVTDVTKEFLNDLATHNLRSLSEAKKIY